ncbi:MAG: 2-C-methyl-D-erythritol 4-phosphate cytidylyltransferase [Longimicrobiales bacterium]
MTVEVETAKARQRPGDACRVGVAIPAAGTGQRMGGARKPFLQLCGEPLLLHSLRPFLADSRVIWVCVALALDDAEQPPEWLTSVDERVVVVKGGATRGASVMAAIAALGDVDVIAVHDAARPLVTADVVSTCIDRTAQGHGVVAGCPAVDTMKVVDDTGRILSTADRATLWHAHTPQVFPAEVLRAAYASGDDAATDDAALVEGQGGIIEMVDDGGLNLKVTRLSDLVIAEAVLRARADE